MAERPSLSSFQQFRATKIFWALGSRSIARSLSPPQGDKGELVGEGYEYGVKFAVGNTVAIHIYVFQTLTSFSATKAYYVSRGSYSRNRRHF